MRVLQTVFYIVGILCAAAASANSATQGMERKLDERLSVLSLLNGFSGAVLVARDGHVLLAKGYGYANIEWGQSNTPSTRFAIASITKSFTAVAVMQLREQGKLALTDSICKYLESCPQAWRSVTLHHLLSHTSGISNYFWGNEPESRMSFTREEILARFADLPLEFEPGSQFHYGNSGYFLLGRVIEKVTGKSYEQALRAQIFEPLAMHDTGYDRAESVVERRAAGYSRLEGKFANAQRADVSWTAAAAGLYSTVEDLYKFDQALYGDGLLTKPSRDLMWTSLELPFTGAPKAKGHYGYGWWTSSPDDPRRSIQGTGGISGFETSLYRYPQSRTTVIVLGNVTGGASGTAAIQAASTVFDTP